LVDVQFIFKSVNCLINFAVHVQKCELFDLQSVFGIVNFLFVYNPCSKVWIVWLIYNLSSKISIILNYFSQVLLKRCSSLCTVAGYGLDDRVKFRRGQRISLRRHIRTGSGAHRLVWVGGALSSAAASIRPPISI